LKPGIFCLLNIKGACRYKDIKQLTPGVSDNVQAGAMKELITAQLVQRAQYNEVPLRVEYSLTGKGRNYTCSAVNLSLGG